MDSHEFLFVWATASTVGLSIFGIICLVISGVFGESIRDLVEGRDSLSLEQEKERAALFVKEDRWKAMSSIFFIFAGIALLCMVVIHFTY